MASWDLTCNNQARQRSKFFFLEYGKSGVDSSVQSNNPYEYNNTGELKYSQTQLNMRRKAEILKYNKNRTVTQSSNKGKWTYLSNIRPTNNRSARDKSVCPNTPQPSSSSDVPGPVIPLILDESVPLYNYLEKPIYQRVDYDAMKRIYDDFPQYNINGLNGTTNTFTNLVILNPNDNQFVYDLSIPIYVQYEADYTTGYADPISSAQLYVYSAEISIYYSDTLVYTIPATFRTSPTTLPTDIVESTLTSSLTFNTSQNTRINVSQYAGVLYVTNIPLQTVTQYVYTFKVKVNIGYSEYNTGDNPVRSNNEGSNMSNTDATNITNVKYNTIVNIESKDIKPRIIHGCDVDIYDVNGDVINYNTVEYIPYNLTGTPSL